MSNWRAAILNHFVPKISKLTLVADPDALLTEEKLAIDLKTRGFDLIEFHDPIEFRYAYESNYRAISDHDQSNDLVVVLRLRDTALDSLPYDLLQVGRKLSFNLGALFPKLSYPVVERLDRGLLDAMYEAQIKSPPDCLGDNATLDFILRHIFGVAAELIHNDVELMRALLHLHYERTQMPLHVAERLIEALRLEAGFQAWPLAEIVPDANAFFSFLQERWPIFIDQRLGRGQQLDYGLKYPGPDLLPFDHQDIKVYIDNLFVEGKMTPIELDEIELVDDFWIRCGLTSPGAKGEERRIQRLFELVSKDLPSPESSYSDWTAFAIKLAELSALSFDGNLSDGPYHAQLTEVDEAINVAFADWLRGHYASLINLSPTKPAMLHHVARHLAGEVENSNQARLALIVVDGLALDQWVAIRQILQKQDSNLVMRESATFAWIPTLTSVSRQAIFAGKPPLYFPSSINSTNSEEKLWKQFWEGQGFSRINVAYHRGLGDGEASHVLENIIHPGQTKFLGLVLDKVDKIMHGIQLGSAGMHNQIRQWCQGGFLSGLVRYLLDHGYETWLTSDHGNIECVGRGRPTEGVMAETRGERARIYPSRELRSQVGQKFTFAHEWSPVGLPDSYFPLLAGGKDAFVKSGDSVVGHGGLTIEEVIVPLVKFERKTL